MSRQFLAELRAMATILASEEEKLRREQRRRLEALGDERQRAHRRLHLLSAMVAVLDDGGPAAAVARFLAETGIEPDADLRAELDALAADVAAAVTGDPAADPVGRLAALERWYQARFNRDLLALLEPAESFRPAVDF